MPYLHIWELDMETGSYVFNVYAEYTDIKEAIMDGEGWFSKMLFNLEQMLGEKVIVLSGRARFIKIGIVIFTHELEEPRIHQIGYLVTRKKILEEFKRVDRSELPKFIM